MIKNVGQESSIYLPSEKMLDDVVLVRVYQNLMLPEQLRMETVSKRSQKISLATWASQEIDISVGFDNPIVVHGDLVTINKSQDYVLLNTDCPERIVQGDPWVFDENLDFFRKRFKKIKKLTVYMTGLSLGQTSAYGPSFLERMNDSVVSVKTLHLVIWYWSGYPDVDANAITALTRPFLKFKHSLNCLRLSVVRSKSFRDCFKSYRRLGKLLLGNFDIMFENDTLRWLSGTFGEKTSKLKHLRLAFSYPRSLQFLSEPIVHGVLEKLKSISLHFDFVNLSNSTAFEQLFGLASRNKRGTEIKISNPLLPEESHPPKANLKKFLQFLLRISNQRPSDCEKNLVKVSLLLNQHENIESDIQDMRDSGNFGRIEIIGKREIKRQLPWPYQNEVEILYKSNLLVTIYHDRDHHCYTPFCCCM